MPFHIHVPKPLHGWKAFFNEITVIVLGVLIALGLEAIVEELHWRHKVAEGKERLRLEIHTDFGFAAEQAVITPCTLAQLDRLREHLMHDGAGQPPMSIDEFPDNRAVFRIATRPWSHNTWEALQHDGTSSHLPEHDQRYLGALYSEIEIITAQTQQSGIASGQFLVTGFPGRLSAETRSQLLLLVAEQYRRTQYMGRLAGQIMGIARDTGYQPEDDKMVEEQLSHTYAADPIGFCKANHLPLGDWKAVMAKVPPLAKRSI